MKEFLNSESDKPIAFKVNGEEFETLAPSKLPANVQLRYTELINTGRLQFAHVSLFNDILEEDSAKRFLDGLESKEKPITITTMAKVANWLIETFSGNVMG